MNHVMALAIAGFLTAGITSAYAEGDRNYFDVPPNGSVVANTDVAGVTGSDAYPIVRNDQAVGVVAGGTLPTNGSDGIVQTANSLPRGFQDGTGNGATAYASAQSPIVAGGTLPTNGSNGIVQTANSLPASTIYGTTAFADAAHGRPSRQVAGSAAKARG